MLICREKKLKITFSWVTSINNYVQLTNNKNNPFYIPGYLY